MNFTQEIVNDILFIDIEGDLLGVNNELKLMDYINEHVEERIVRCAIDISKVNYMNSTGLSLLIRVLTRFRNRNGEVVLINPSESVAKLLVITKLNAIFTIVKTREEAMKALK